MAIISNTILKKRCDRYIVGVWQCQTPTFDDLKNTVIIAEELNQTNQAVKILELVFNETNAKKSNDVDDRLKTLVSIAKAFAKITKKVDSNKSQARNFVCRFTS